jgi:hypothetical protein
MSRIHVVGGTWFPLEIANDEVSGRLPLKKCMSEISDR